MAAGSTISGQWPDADEKSGTVRRRLAGDRRQGALGLLVRAVGGVAERTRAKSCRARAAASRRLGCQRLVAHLVETLWQHVR